jgi:hypothetical protein
VGTFGLDASVYPGRDNSAGSDHYRDIGFDATFQDDWNDRNTFLIQANYIHEVQNLTASYALGNTANASNDLNSARATISYYYQQTYGLVAGYFGTWASRDGGLYAPDPIVGSASGRPNSHGYIIEATYTPFGKDSSPLAPWLNVRLGLEYTAYTEFNGAGTNYDGSGRKAADNNTFYGYMWFAF